MAISAESCLAQAEAARRQFGDHGYFDKWAWESLDCQAIVAAMADMDAAVVTEVLVSLVRSGRTGRHLAEGLLAMLDEREDFEAIISPEFAGLL
jgi:hypothetical protein